MHDVSQHILDRTWLVMWLLFLYYFNGLAQMIFNGAFYLFYMLPLMLRILLYLVLSEFTFLCADAPLHYKIGRGIVMTMTFIIEIMTLQH